jgi:signal transduction histidine kinase
VSEQRRELINVNKDLQLAVHAKENFLAIVSHELLTPLTAILGWIDVAKLNNGNHEIVMKSLDVCLSNANRQRRLIRDLLDASRLSHGKLSISCERCTLWELATQSVESVQQMAEEKSITIKMVPPSTKIFVHVDPMRFVQVISNLLTNAIKFTPSKGSITVTGTLENNTAKIAITDTGHGIEQEDLVHIFDLFHQGSYHQSGVGIGLALVKGILDLHGGAIQVSSPGVGLGSTFTIEIPVENPTVTPSNATSSSRATTLML